eukprot:3317723-Rhodomonas_salina.1
MAERHARHPTPTRPRSVSTANFAHRSVGQEGSSSSLGHCIAAVSPAHYIPELGTAHCRAEVSPAPSNTSVEPHGSDAQQHARSRTGVEHLT